MRASLLIILFFLLPTKLHLLHAENLALLIGVGNYPADSGWKHLSSANDVALIKKTLLAQDFKEENIAVILNQAATKEGIIKALEKQLYKKIKAGDQVVFHFSGHGQQVWDDSGDEIDQLDEALVPYDSPKQYKASTNEGQYLLRDDELSILLNKIRNKLGAKGSLLVLMDACHSGTATRARTTARGTDIILASPAQLQELEKDIDTKKIFDAELNQGDENIAPLVALYSSGANQLSYEYKGKKERYGLFSFAFCKAMTSLGTSANYKNLLDHITLEIRAFTHRQTPQGEGNLNQRILKDGIKISPSYCTVLKVLAKDYIVINAGTLLAYSPMSKVALYPLGTSDFANTKPLARGFIDIASAFDADVILDKSIEKELLNKAIVVLEEKNYGELATSIQLELNDVAIEDSIRNHLSKIPYISIVEQEADLYLESPTGLAGNSSLILYGNDDATLWRENLNNKADLQTTNQRMLQSIHQYLRANYLRNLETKKTSLKANIQLLKENEKGTFEILENASVRVGDRIKIRINNLGNRAFYFTLLDILPDHTIANIYPGLEDAIDFQINPKAYFETPIFKTTAPIGTDILKIIATEQPMDLRNLRGASNGTFNPLEVLLSNLIHEGEDTRSINNSTLPGQVGFIGSLVVEIGE